MMCWGFKSFERGERVRRPIRTLNEVTRNGMMDHWVTKKMGLSGKVKLPKSTQIDEIKLQ